MFGIGMPEMLLILALALVVIGPKKLPDIAKTLGRAMREFRRATSEFKEAISVDDDFSGVKKAFKDINTEIKSNVDYAPVPEYNPESDAGSPEIQAGEPQRETESASELTDLNHAFEELNADKGPAAEPEHDVDDKPTSDSGDASDKNT